MDHRRPFGCHAAGHTRDDSHHARTDVTSHREVDTLVQRNKPRNDHRDGDRRHDGGGLDNSGDDGSQEHQQQRVAYRSEEQFDGVERRKLVHGIRHHTQTDEQHTEARQDTACLLPCIALGE